MSEHAPRQPENFKSFESLANQVEHAIEAGHNVEPVKNERPVEAVLKDARELIQENADTEAHTQNAFDKVEADNEAAQHAATPTVISNELKMVTLRRELKAIQRQLPARQRAMSKVIHQPAVRALSDVSSKTVSRASGLLGGGIMAFVGSCAYLWLANNQGFRYNYFVFILFFVGGFALGVVLEALVWVATSSRRKATD